MSTRDGVVCSRLVCFSDGKLRLVRYENSTGKVTVAGANPRYGFQVSSISDGRYRLDDIERLGGGASLYSAELINLLTLDSFRSQLVKNLACPHYLRAFFEAPIGSYFDDETLRRIRHVSDKESELWGIVSEFAFDFVDESGISRSGNIKLLKNHDWLPIEFKYQTARDGQRLVSGLMECAYRVDRGLISAERWVLTLDSPLHYELVVSERKLSPDEARGLRQQVALSHYGLPEPTGFNNSSRLFKLTVLFLISIGGFFLLYLIRRKSRSN